MWKFQVNKAGEAVKYHMIEQGLSSDIARFIPNIANAQREDIRVFFLDKKAYLEGKVLLSDKETYKVYHAPNGDCAISFVSDDSVVLTVKAIEKEWSELYQENEEGEEIYLIKEE